MKKLKYLIAILLFLTTALFGEDEIRFGVYAYMGYEKTRQKYEPLVEHLNKKLDKKVILDVFTHDELERKIKNREVDIITTNLIIKQNYGLGGAIATLVESKDSHITSKLGGVIVVRADSPIKTLQDVKNGTILTGGVEHLGGFKAQAYELYKIDIDILKNREKIIEKRVSHQEILKMLVEKKGDIAFVKDGILEKMIKSGEIKKDEIRVVNEQKNSKHPYIVSTALYPEWPVYALPHVSDSDVKKFLSALFEYDSNSTTDKSTIKSYTLPADYLPVEDITRKLKLPPFDKVKKITFDDMWEQRKERIIAIGSIVFALVFFYIRERRAKKFAHSLLLNIGEGVYGVDDVGRCTWINKKALEMLGYKESEVLGKNQHDLFHHHRFSHEHYAVEECPIYQTVKDGVLREVEDFFIRKDGTFFPVTLTVAPRDDGGAIVIFRNISDLIEKQEELKKSENFFRTLFEIFPEAIVMTDLQTRLPYRFNKVAHMQLGYSEDEFAHISINDYEVIESPQEIEKHIQNILKEGHDSFETKHRAKDGELLDIAVSLQMIIFENKEYLLSVHRDITQIKKYQRQLLETTKEAQRANSVKSQFLANMSHEIRTPMNAIIGLSEMMFDTKLDEKQKNIITKVNSSSRILLGIINDILDYSKVEAGKLDFENKDFSLLDIVMQLDALFSQNALEKKVELCLVLSSDAPCVVGGDELRLKQVLINLLSNALKFTSSGSVSLFVSLVEKRGKNALISFSVSDTGIGMSEQEIEKLFKPFTQADSSTTRKYGGTGLGLSISKKIVEALGGKFLVESQKNAGSTFSFELEFEVKSWEQNKSIQNNTKKGELDFSGVKILLVEDNEINQEVAAMMLNRVGIEVDVASNGKIGLNKYLANRDEYDLILMDLQMPIMSGYEAAKAIREHDEKIPIIALSAAAMIEDRQKVMAVGMNEHLGKPIDTVKLYEMIAKFIGKTFIQVELPVRTQERVVDLEYLRKSISSDELINKLLMKFLQQLNGEFSNIVSLVENSQEEAKAMIHALKGVSGNLGLNGLFEVCKEIDLSYKLSKEITKESIAQLEESIQSVKKELSELKNLEHVNKHVDMLGKDELQQLFFEIKNELLNASMLSLNQKEILVKNLEGLVDRDELLEFNNALEEFEYDKALTIMNGWKL